MGGGRGRGKGSKGEEEGRVTREERIREGYRAGIGVEGAIEREEEREKKGGRERRREVLEVREGGMRDIDSAL